MIAKLSIAGYCHLFRKSGENLLCKIKHLFFDLYILLLTYFCMVLNKCIKFSAVTTMLKRPCFYCVFLLIGGYVEDQIKLSLKLLNLVLNNYFWRACTFMAGIAVQVGKERCKINLDLFIFEFIKLVFLH